MKQCIKCLVDKPLDDFTKSKINKSGYRGECKSCQKIYMEQWRAKKIAETVKPVSAKRCSVCKKNKPAKDFYKSNVLKSGLMSSCISCVSDKSKEFRKNHPGHRADYIKKWVAENPEAVRKIKRDWNHRNKDAVRSKVLQRRARLKTNGLFDIRRSFLRRLYASPCIACGSNKNIQADHVLPLSRGGRHSEGNLQPLCRDCNYRKHHKTMMEWKMQKIVKL